MSGQAYEQLTLFPEDSHASPSQWMESKRAKRMIDTSGRRCSELSESCARTALSGKTFLDLFESRLRRCFPNCKNIGYEARAYSSAARDVGGLHKGERVFIVAAANDGRAAVRRNTQLPADGGTERRGGRHGGGAEKPDLWKRWEVEPRPYGVAHGIPNRVDRLKCLGNAVVPQQAYPIFKALMEEILKGGKA